MSSAQANAYLKQNNKGPLSGALYAPQSSIFQPKPFRKISNYSMSAPELSPTIIGATNQESRWQILNTIGTYLYALVLDFDVPTTNLTVPGAGAALALADYFGYAAIEEVVLRYNGSDVRRISGDELRIQQIKQSKEKRDSLDDVIGGPKSVADRINDYVNGSTYSVEIPFHFDSASHPLIMATATTLDVFVKWRRLEDVIEIVAGAPTRPTSTTYTNQKLRAHVVHATQDEQALVQSMTQANTGIMYLQKPFVEMELEFALSNSVGGVASREISLELKQINKPVESLWFVLRRKNDVQGTAAEGPDRFSYRGDPEDPLVRITDYRIESASGIIKERKDYQMMKLDKMRHLSGIDFDDNIWYVPFGWAPQQKNQFSGHLELQNIQSRFIYLTINEVVQSDETLVLSVYADSIDMTQERRGDYRQLFA